MIDKPKVYLCSWCKRGVVNTLPATCPNPDCRAELTDKISENLTAKQFQQQIGKVTPKPQ